LVRDEGRDLTLGIRRTKGDPGLELPAIVAQALDADVLVEAADDVVEDEGGTGKAHDGPERDVLGDGFDESHGVGLLAPISACITEEPRVSRKRRCRCGYRTRINNGSRI
jgi:hypothetical protein